MLNLDFTPEQDMLREAVRGLCRRLSPLERVRELEDDPDGIARELWDQLGELGLCGLMVPESLGGSEMSLIDGVVVYEELGRALAPVPHFVSCVLSAAAIVASGNGLAELLAEPDAELDVSALLARGAERYGELARIPLASVAAAVAAYEPRRRPARRRA